jgi:DNA polymerase-3 subunit delta
MAGDLKPQHVLKSLEKGQLSSFYLFYGPNEFHLEKVLSNVSETFLPPGARDLNLRVFYGDESEAADIIDSACSLPFLSDRRLIIVRRTEAFAASALETFIPYLENPVESTCLIFVSSITNFSRKFYKRIRDLGGAVNFQNLGEREIVPWIRKTAKGLGLNIEGQACARLYEIVGNRLADLYSELEKLHLRYGEASVGVEEVKELAINSRFYTIFELMDRVSFRRCPESIAVLNRFLEEEDRSAPLKLVGMLSRQIRLLWPTGSIVSEGGHAADVARKLGLRDFQARRLVQQSEHWNAEELEEALELVYKADGLIKSGSQSRMVLENFVLSVCQ